MGEVKTKVAFSEFLSEVELGNVIKVEIQGNNINGVLSNGSNFSTYSPNYPNLVEKLSERGVNIVASPLEDKMPSLLGILYYLGFQCCFSLVFGFSLCVKCKEEKVELWDLANRKQNF